MVESGCDVDCLISDWHHEFTLGGLVATLPWLVHPIITNRWFKRFLIPSKGNNMGSGHIMSVSEASCSLQNLGVLKWLMPISVPRKVFQVSSGQSSIGS